MERVEHPYECTAKGHEGGDRTFYDAPPDYFINKGMSTPRNCQACRKWIKSQKDEKKRCKCGFAIEMKAKAKISHFKKDGPYIPPEECKSCSEGNRPPDGIKDRPDRDKKNKRKNAFDSLDNGLVLEPLTILLGGDYYEKLISNYKLNITEPRKVHLEHHIPGSAHDWTDPSIVEVIGLKKPSSPSVFASGNTVDSLLANAQEYLSSTDVKNTREYRVHPSRTVRVTYIEDHDGLELTFLDHFSEGIAIASTYDNVTVTEVKTQTWYKDNRRNNG